MCVGLSCLVTTSAALRRTPRPLSETTSARMPPAGFEHAAHAARFRGCQLKIGSRQALTTERVNTHRQRRERAAYASDRARRRDVCTRGSSMAVRERGLNSVSAGVGSAQPAGEPPRAAAHARHPARKPPPPGISTRMVQPPEMRLSGSKRPASCRESVQPSRVLHELAPIAISSGYAGELGGGVPTASNLRAQSYAVSGDVNASGNRDGRACHKGRGLSRSNPPYHCDF